MRRPADDDIDDGDLSFAGDGGHAISIDDLDRLEPNAPPPREWPRRSH